MASNEKTSAYVAALAAYALRNPRGVTPAQIQTLAASALTQSPDKKKKK